MIRIESCGMAFLRKVEHAGQDRGQAAALAHRAADLDATALGLGEAFGQSESQPRALVALGRAAVELLELDEQPVEIVLADPDSIVLDFDAEELAVHAAAAHPHAAVLGRELE